MGLKEGPSRADSREESSTPRGINVIKLRRRSVAATAASDLPFCGMCGSAMRVDASTGRCALGHRVTAPGTILPQPVVSSDPTEVIQTPFESTAPLPVVEAAFEVEPTAGPVGDGLYEAYQSANAASDRAVTWDDVVAPATDAFSYDDYAAWDEPTSGFSSLDVDADRLPAADAQDAELGYGQMYGEGFGADYDDYAPSAAPTTTPVAAELLDELDDAAYARRKAAGTIGATIAATGALFASIAVLPL